MRAFVDQDLCIGCGRCVELAGSVFTLNADGRAEAAADTAYELAGAVRDAVEACPVNAIREEA